jgi:hypothetical protein
MSRPKTSPKARTAAFPYSEAEIKRALAPWRPRALPFYEQDELKVTDPNFDVIIALAHEGAKHIRGRRAGGSRERKPAQKVLLRQTAIVETYRDLPARLQAHPSGTATIERLRQGVIKKLGLNDDGISEDTIRHDVRELRVLLQIIQKVYRPAAPSRPSGTPKDR